jgi:hypothetical protein
MAHHERDGMANPEGSARSTAGRSVRIAGTVILLAAVVWAGAVLFTRGAVSPSAYLGALMPDAIVERADDLPSATPGNPPFEVWGASTQESGTVGVLYVTTIANPVARDGLAPLLLQPRSLTIAVVVDPSAMIQEVHTLAPRTLVGSASSAASYLDGWKGMSFFQVLTAAEGFAPAGGGALTGPVGEVLSDLATSVYLRDLGREGFDRFMAQVNSPGLQVGFPFPYFAAMTSNGTPFNLGQLAGRKVLMTFTQPTCGSCFEATMTLLNTVAVRKFDIMPVVFVFGDPQLEPVKRFMQDAPKGAILIPDPDSDLARSVHQTLAPYAVILDENHVMRYSGASDEASAVYQYLEQLAGAQ